MGELNMKSTALVKRLLVSSAVLSSILLVTTVQANAAATDDSAVATSEASLNNTETASANSQLTVKTQATSATVQSAVHSNAEQSVISASEASSTTQTSKVSTTTQPVSSASTTTVSADAVATTSESDDQPQSTTATTVNSNRATTTPKINYKSARAEVTTSVVKVDLVLTTQRKTIQAGETATFDLKLAVAGINQTMNEQHLEIDLPTGFKLSNAVDATIDGVTPSYSSDKTKMIYDFKTPINGLSISKQYLFDTSNQVILDGTKLTMGARYFDGNDQLTDSLQSIELASKAVYGVTNQMVGVLKTDEAGNVIQDEAGNVTVDSTKIAGVAGSQVVYQIGISAPKQLLGQAYFEPGSTIKVAYVLPAGLNFAGVENLSAAKASYQNQTDETGQTTVVFSLIAPSLAEQLAAKDNLFSGYLMLLATIDASVPGGTALTTQAQVEATSVNGKQVFSDVATSQMTTAIDLAKNMVPTDGLVRYQYNYGPGLDGKLSLKNVDPQIYPNEQLRFYMQGGPSEFYRYDSDALVTMAGSAGTKYAITKYQMIYNVDPNLNVDTMQVMTPKSYVNTADQTIPFEEMPLCDIYVRYQDSPDFEPAPILTDVSTTNALDMTQYVDNTRGVAQLKFVYTVSPQGLAPGVEFYMSPKAGYYGTVSNDFTVEIAGYTYKGWLDVLYSKDGAIIQSAADGQPATWRGQDLDGVDIHLLDGSGFIIPAGSSADHRDKWNQYMQPKTAEIIKPASNTPRVLNATMSFKTQVNGQVSTGANTLQVMVENNQASLQDFSGLTSFLVLPKGVQYTGHDEQVSVTAKPDGTTVLTINWDRTSLAPNNQNRVDLDVAIDSNLKLLHVTPILYATVNEADTVVPGSLDPTTDTDVQMVPDTADIDQNPVTTTVFKLQKTVALAVSTHEIHVAATASNDRSQTGTSVSIQAGHSGAYGLTFSNGSDQGLQQVEIIGRLPQLDDTGVIDTIDRETTAPLTLAGPIILPNTWQKRVTVSYALAGDPDVYVAVDKVLDFSQVIGFKISYASTDYLATQDIAQLKVPVTMSKEALNGQTAYMSYSVTANGLLVTEGTKAGLVVDLGPRGVPGGGIWVKTKVQVPAGTYVLPADYYDHTKNPEPPSEGQTTVKVPSEPDVTVPVTTPNETVAPLTDNNQTQVGHPTPLQTEKTPSQVTVGNTTAPIEDMTEQVQIQSSVMGQAYTARLPQTNDHQTNQLNLLGLVGMVLAWFGLIGSKRKKEE